MVAQQSSGTDDSVRITAKHSAPDGEQGTAYDLICRLTGRVVVGPEHGRHEVDAPFSGDLKAVS